MSVKDPFSSKTVESKPLRVVMEVVKTKKIVNSFTKTMRRFDMDWNMLGEGTSVRDKIWAEVTLCLDKLCKCWERKFWIRCIFHYLHTQTLQEAGWSLWRSECLHVLSHSRKYFRLLRATEDSSPVGTIWIRKNPTSDLVRICFSLLLLSCWWHQLISVLLTGGEWKEKFWIYVIQQMRRSFTSPVTQTTYSSNSPFSPPKTSCPSSLLLTVPFQREWLLPAESPLAAAH